MLCISGLISRVAWLQVIQSDNLEAKARAVQTHNIKPLGKRYSIVDRRGVLVARDDHLYKLWAHPRYFNFPGDPRAYVREPIEVAKVLSSFLSQPVYELEKVLSSQRSGIKLSESLTGDVAFQIRNLGISGLDLEPYLQRVYPQGRLFANVVGFLNQDRIPQAGLEQSLNKQLLQKEKEINLRTGADGTPLPIDLGPGFVSGNDLTLHLTLDARLQELALEALDKQVKNWNAAKGVAIVMDVNNGDLLALASSPTYDPNKYWKYSTSLYREWSVQDLIEPGSTFKPINLALALQEGVIQPEGSVNDPGRVNIGGWSIFNHDKKANGVIGFKKVLQVSSNVAMVNVMSQIRPSRYWEWLYKLGINVRTKTDLPGAVAGQLKNKEKFIAHLIEPAAASYGQGFSLTPLKLAQLHALIANGGYIVNPRITKGIGKLDKTDFKRKVEKKNLIDQEVTKVVRGWMESVVEEGTGLGARTLGYRIGGKTGTAQKAFKGEYIAGAKICSFVATLPLENPKYVVLVVIDEPKGEEAFGSSVAVPVAKKIIDGLLVLEKIPPYIQISSLNR
tara:strand:+ start:3040 stop:4725 length:1686 start_codon:yes stop_codon:yes gene_type:complete